MDTLLKLTVNIDEANLILGFLGEMPTKHLVEGLYKRLTEECRKQLQPKIKSCPSKSKKVAKEKMESQNAVLGSSI